MKQSPRNASSSSASTEVTQDFLFGIEMGYGVTVVMCDLLKGTSFSEVRILKVVCSGSHI
jgi:hypothetical protein